jgi:TPR repeat protein
MARELFSQAAQLGYAPAQFRLGACHEFGNLGCVIDPRRSIAWYTKAAQKGDPEAELALSGWYLTGSGTSHCNRWGPPADLFRGRLEAIG